MESTVEAKIAELPTLSGLPPEELKEKQNDSGSNSVDLADEKLDLDSQVLDDEKPEYRNGEPVITTGRDVSRFVVDLRDDGGDALTVRSIVLGTVFAGMGAALCQVCTHLLFTFLSFLVLGYWSTNFLLFLLCSRAHSRRSTQLGDNPS